MKEKLEKCIDF